MNAQTPNAILFDWLSFERIIENFAPVCPEIVRTKGYSRGGVIGQTTCGRPLKASVEISYGLAHQLCFYCGNPSHPKRYLWTSERSFSEVDHQTKRDDGHYVVNKRLVLAAVDSDLRDEKLTMFCEILGVH